MSTGRLVLVGTPIGNLADLTPRAVDALRDADVIAAEDTRRTRALLTHAGVPARGRLVAVHEHNERARAAELVDEIRQGRTVALVTDAGMPGVSDPGHRLVRACAAAQLPVEVVPGPSAVVAALAVSGLPGDRFVFEGFLPRKGPARRERLAALAHEARTTVCFESPHRVAATVAELVDVCGPDREVVLARELTKLHEEVFRGTLAAAREHVEATPRRGEYVLVLAGAGPRDAPTDDDVAEEARAALAAGMSARDAAAHVAGRLGVSRRRAYDVVVGNAGGGRATGR
ncbi:MAG TPA: 16S rRNA (cytidine(1402)-2'-O)-methyltransferase [Acidimicrobiia bacterium]|nr:16S rRNA (cytidine(1402)-2'-O)-methyltransferase [Acidimicrobiia bacterium]